MAGLTALLLPWRKKPLGEYWLSPKQAAARDGITLIPDEYGKVPVSPDSSEARNAHWNPKWFVDNAHS